VLPGETGENRGSQCVWPMFKSCWDVSNSTRLYQSRQCLSLSRVGPPTCPIMVDLTASLCFVLRGALFVSRLVLVQVLYRVIQESFHTCTKLISVCNGSVPTFRRGYSLRIYHKTPPMRQNRPFILTRCNKSPQFPCNCHIFFITLYLTLRHSYFPVYGSSPVQCSPKMLRSDAVA
jgi:hypothetical protein